MEKTIISNELKTHFLRLYQMAFSDDNFDVSELQMLYQFAKDRGISEEQLNSILLNPANNISIPKNIEVRIEYLYDLALMIWADGVVNVDERNTLKKYCKRFEFLDKNLEELTSYLLDNAEKKVKKEEIISKLNSF